MAWARNGPSLKVTFYLTIKDHQNFSDHVLPCYLFSLMGAVLLELTCVTMADTCTLNIVVVIYHELIKNPIKHVVTIPNF